MHAASILLLTVHSGNDRAIIKANALRRVLE